MRACLPLFLGLGLGLGCTSTPEPLGPGEAPTPMYVSEGREEPPEPEPEPEPATTTGLPETLQPVPMPARAATHYGLVVRTEPGIAGRVVLNEEVLGNFGLGGHSMASNDAQCALRSGDNQLVVEVFERDGTAAAPEGGDLISVDLHGGAQRSFPSEENRLFHVQFSPNGPERRILTFALRSDQTPSPSAECAARNGGTLTLDGSEES